MSGLAMQAAASSRPASGRRAPVQPPVGDGGPRATPDDEAPLSHGFKVGVGSIAIAVALRAAARARPRAPRRRRGRRRAGPRGTAVERGVRAAHTTPGLDEAAVERDPRQVRRRRRARASGSRCCASAGRRCATAARRAAADRRRAARAARGRGLPGRPRGDRADARGAPGDLHAGADDPPPLHGPRPRRRRPACSTSCVDELFAAGGFWAGGDGEGLSGDLDRDPRRRRDGLGAQRPGRRQRPRRAPRGHAPRPRDHRAHPRRRGAPRARARAPRLGARLPARARPRKPSTARRSCSAA